MELMDNRIRPKQRLQDLAIMGGEPAFERELHVGYPSVGDETRLRQRIDDILASRRLTNQGPYVREFESGDHCVFVQRLHLSSEFALLPIDYFNLNLVCDVFLDTLDWSACVTTMDALACDLPIVTCRGRYFRGRQSYGILRMLGIRETIANGKREYIETAVKLGSDPKWRSKIVEEIKARRRSRLFGDLGCIPALEDFYFRIVRHRAELERRSVLDLGRQS